MRKPNAPAHTTANVRSSSIWGDLLVAVSTAIVEGNNDCRHRAAKSAEDQYWDGRLSIVLESIEQLRCIPIRQFGSYPCQRSHERKIQAREQECNEFRCTAKRAALDKNKWNMERVESSIRMAVMMAS